MPNSGTIILTPIPAPTPVPPVGPISVLPYPAQVVQAFGDLIEECSSIKLARYAQIIGYDERPFFGINYSGMSMPQCRTIWTLDQRKMIADALCEAQIEIEQETGYPVGIKWIEDDEQAYNCLASARYTHVIEGGIEASEYLAQAEPVDHTNDPAVIGPIALADNYSTDEIHVFYPGTEIEIPPSLIDLDTALQTVTIYIPRARMVDPDFINNDDTGIAYTDLANFLTTVDVVRIYNDDSQQAVLYSPQTCSTVCTIDEHTACIQVLQGNIGYLRIVPTTGCNCGNYKTMKLYYRAGVPMTKQAEDAIIRLAHSKMPEEPCGCDVAQRLWSRDRNVPENYSPERAYNPFGLSDGAWIAWQFAKAMKSVRGSIL